MISQAGCGRRSTRRCCQPSSCRGWPRCAERAPGCVARDGSSAGAAPSQPVTPSKDGHGRQLLSADSRRNNSGGIPSPLGWSSSARQTAANDRAAPGEKGADCAGVVARLCNFKEGLLQQRQKTWGAPDLLFCLLQSLAASAA